MIAFRVLNIISNPKPNNVLLNLIMMPQKSNILSEKGRDLTQSFDKSPYTHRKHRKAKRQQNFD